MLDQLKQGVLAEILGEMLLRKYYPLIHYPTWDSGKNIFRHVGGAEFWAKSLFSFFSSLLFFFFFPLRLVFLVIVFCFVSLYSVSFFTFIYFLPYCLISLSSYFLPFPRSAPRGLAIHVFLIIDLNLIG